MSAYALIINAKSRRVVNGTVIQEIGDITGIFDYPNGPTQTERTIFDVLQIPTLSKSEIETILANQLPPDYHKAKFPFNINQLTTLELSSLPTASKPAIRNTLKKLTPK